MNNFVTIENHSFYNCLMHEQLNFKTQIVIYKLFKTCRSRWTEWSSNIFV